MTATISGSAVSTLVALTTTGNTILGDASTDTLNVGNGDLVKDASGNVGIGTTSPARKLDVRGSLGMQVNEDAVGTKVISIRSDFASAGPAINVTTNDPLLFLTNNTERARIDTSGNLLVGGTVVDSSGGVAVVPSTAASGACGLLAFNKGNQASETCLRFKYQGTVVGSITYSNTATAYNTSSDYRLKENIAPMTGALAKVVALKPCTYKWKIDGSDGQGFIAHELDEVVEGCVTGEKDAVDAEGNPQYQGIDTSFLVATLTAAIQEQQALITSLTTRLTALENK